MECRFRSNWNFSSAQMQPDQCNAQHCSSWRRAAWDICLQIQRGHNRPGERSPAQGQTHCFQVLLMILLQRGIKKPLFVKALLKAASHQEKLKVPEHGFTSGCGMGGSKIQKKSLLHSTSFVSQTQERIKLIYLN